MTFQITIARHTDVRMLARLLYSDVKVLEQWENDDRVAIFWQRDNAFLNTNQRDRLASGNLPTYEGLPALQWLVDEMGLNVPCLEA